MASFRVTVVCFWNGSIRSSGSNVKYVGGRRKLFACNSNMDLNEFKHLICSKIGIDTTRSTINVSFKYNMSGELLALPVEDEEAIDAMWEYSKSTSIPSLELYVEEVPLGNQDVNVVETNAFLNVTSSAPSPLPFPTQETQNPIMPYSSSPFNDDTFNLEDTNEPWDDVNSESNEFVEAPSEDDVGVDEEALANDMTLGNIPTIVAPTPYALVPPLDEHVEDNSWRSWACDTTYTDEGEFQKGMMFDNKDALLDAVRLYHIRRNVEYRTETSNQTVLTLKCKRGCAWRLRARKSSYSPSWEIVTYKGKHGGCVLSNENVSAGHIHLTSSVINNLIRNCVAEDPSIKVSVVR